MARQRSKGRVGVVGLGIMGGAFATNLAAAGWQVIGYDIDPAQNRKAARAGVEIAKDAADLAARVPIILASLPDPAALHLTVRKINAARLSSRILAEMSTLTIDDKRKALADLAAGGHRMLDCPVSGTGAQAKARDIVIYASGDRAAFRKLKPVFAGFAREAADLGDFGNGSRMKYVANLLVAIHNVASAEAMVLGIQAGLSPEQIVKLVSAGAGNSRIFELRAPMMARNRYDDATMKISVWQKDMKVIGSYARDIGVPTPLFDATQPVYDKAIALGLGEKDTAAVCAVLERIAGNPRPRTARRRK
jgi:3-hydroxyisobutyrate dehydrogenase-like beta-hydroxyacid dehydrogenase